MDGEDDCARCGASLEREGWARNTADGVRWYCSRECVGLAGGGVKVTKEDSDG